MGSRALLFVMVLALAGCRSLADGSPITLVLANVTLVDVGDGTRRAGAYVLVEGDRIASIAFAEPTSLPADALILDGTGRWVIPGLIDVHVHDASTAYLRDMLAWGVTSILLMPSTELDGPPDAPTPRLQPSEMFAGDFPDNLFPGAYPFLKPTTPGEARRLVRESHARGHRQIKIIRDDSVQWSGEAYRVPALARPVYDALVEQARVLGMRVYVHATQREVARAALEAGVDAFLHGVMDEPLRADDLERMARSGTAWTPAMNALYCFGDQRSYARRVLADERFVALLEAAEREQWSAIAEAPEPIVLLVENTEAYVSTLTGNTKSVQDSGIAVAVGTDGGPGGVSTHLELELLAAGGLSPIEVLRAGTLGGAAALGRRDDLGSVERGKLADLVVLSADPTLDVRNCREIEWVVLGGRPYRPSELALENQP